MMRIRHARIVGIVCILLTVLVQQVTGMETAKAAVKLNKTKITLEAGDSYQLKLEKTTKKITWRSSKKSVAAVSKKGLVKAKKAGKTTITATVGTKKYKCIVTVKKEVEAINQIDLIIGNETFLASVEQNETAQALFSSLPMALTMNEMNGNEKYYFMDSDIRKDNASCPGTIQAGDIMCYADNCIVIFYETFQTSYSYVKLGHIDNTDGLKAAFGAKSIKVTFQ